MSVAVLGIDPGKTGSFALRSPFFTEVYPFERAESGEIDLYKCRAWLVRMIKKYGITNLPVWIEAVHAFPGQGVTSMFSFGKTTGHLEGLMIGLGLHVKRVTPRHWQSTMHEGFLSEKDAKKRSLMVAQKLFGLQMNFLATERSTTPHMGIVDALLIAEYGARLLGFGLT